MKRKFQRNGSALSRSSFSQILSSLLMDSPMNGNPLKAGSKNPTFLPLRVLLSMTPKSFLTMPSSTQSNNIWKNNKKVDALFHLKRR